MKMDFSDTELGQDLLPAGKYHVLVTDGEVRQTGDDSKHPGTDYWNIELTVQDGPYAGRKDWVNVMLDPYEKFTLGNLVVATGEYTKEDLKNGDVPEIELFEDDLTEDDGLALVGQEYVVTIKEKKRRGSDQMNRNHRFYQYDPATWEEEEGTSLLPG